MFSLNKLEKRAEQVLPGCEGGGEIVVGGWEAGWEGGRGGEVAQTMYTHMNKCINNNKK
jgi:hypothetical protein